MLVLVMAKERRLRGGARLVDSVGDSCEEELEVLQPQDVEALRVRLEKEGARAGRAPLKLVQVTELGDDRVREAALPREDRRERESDVRGERVEQRR